MTPELMSHDVFVAILSAFTGIVAATWFVYDALKLWWLRKADGADPTVHDQRFGYAIGVMVGAIGLLGLMKYYL